MNTVKCFPVFASAVPCKNSTDQTYTEEYISVLIPKKYGIGSACIHTADTGSIQGRYRIPYLLRVHIRGKTEFRINTYSCPYLFVSMKNTAEYLSAFNVLSRRVAFFPMPQNHKMSHNHTYFRAWLQGSI